MTADFFDEARGAFFDILRHWSDTLGRHRATFALRRLDVVLVIVGVQTAAKRLDVGLVALIRRERYGLGRGRSGPG